MTSNLASATATSSRFGIPAGDEPCQASLERKAPSAPDPLRRAWKLCIVPWLRDFSPPGACELLLSCRSRDIPRCYTSTTISSHPTHPRGSAPETSGSELHLRIQVDVQTRCWETCDRVVTTRSTVLGPEHVVTCANGAGRRVGEEGHVQDAE